ncbi:hypothetical protein Ngar_c05050 [Candidatus Nitrososphaera gargensis Ga9.2]|uniref:Uncharacterized protein n=1 Tax=Nitrososphaera gargensis (strain Ga9.2) TaxID=1237085 RepID=K0ILY9_NITGG|nr:hypothetical protein [Candidatus Nitrososphaera gargensis]AFU57449.1 hypothetical protein Ngar_c05050 [Candidatus Nitrososphaera gargensis Ga9.2]
MHLKRGHIMLIAGGALVVVSFSMLGYYGLQFVSSIQQDKSLTVEPGGSLQVQQNINASQGAYVVAFPNFKGQPSVTITGPGGQVVVERTIEPPIIIEPFDAEQPGAYTLVLSNPTDQVLEANIVLGDQETVLSRGINISSAVTALVFTSLLGIGIAVAVAGAIITILDRRRISKMKQFGDTRDLV